MAMHVPFEATHDGSFLCQGFSGRDCEQRPTRVNAGSQDFPNVLNASKESHGAPNDAWKVIKRAHHVRNRSNPMGNHWIANQLFMDEHLLDDPASSGRHGIRIESMTRQGMLGCGLIAGLGVALVAQESAPVRTREIPAVDLMQAKLASTQDVVEGLVQKDFRRINNAASQLVAMCQGEGWDTHPDVTYQAYRDQLQRQSRKLLDQAGSRNLEGATYAYLGVLSTCVDCHTHCRDVLKIAAHDPDLIPIPTAADSSGAVTR